MWVGREREGGERVWGGFSGTVREGEQQEEELEFANKAPSPFLKKTFFLPKMSKFYRILFSRTKLFSFGWPSAFVK